MIGAGASEDRSIAALNVALAAARDGARVLMIDADHATHALSNKVNGLGKSEASRLGWLSIGTKASRAIKTANGISILPAIKDSDAKAGEAIRKAIAQARSAGGYDLVILDGPAMPWGAADRKLLDTRRRPRRDPAGRSRYQRLHGRHHRSARRRRAQAGRRRPQRAQPRGGQPPARQAICLSAAQIRSEGPPPPTFPESRWGACGSPCSTSSRPRIS